MFPYVQQKKNVGECRLSERYDQAPTTRTDTTHAIT